MTDPVLTLEGLGVRLPPGADRSHALRDVSLAIQAGEILCVVGESGSGKSMTANAVMRLLPVGVAIDGGRVMFGGRDITKLSDAEMRTAATPPGGCSLGRTAVAASSVGQSAGSTRRCYHTRSAARPAPTCHPATPTSVRTPRPPK